jgi:hypothetical protein
MAQGPSLPAPPYRSNRLARAAGSSVPSVRRLEFLKLLRPAGQDEGHVSCQLDYAGQIQGRPIPVLHFRRQLVPVDLGQRRLSHRSGTVGLGSSGSARCGRANLARSAKN